MLAVLSAYSHSSTVPAATVPAAWLDCSIILSTVLIGSAALAACRNTIISGITVQGSVMLSGTAVTLEDCAVLGGTGVMVEGSECNPKLLRCEVKESSSFAVVVKDAGDKTIQILQS